MNRTLKRAERPLSSLESFVESVLEAKVPGSDGKPPILAIEFLAETMAESAQGEDSNDSSLRKAKAVEVSEVTPTPHLPSAIRRN